MPDVANDHQALVILRLNVHGSAGRLNPGVSPVLSPHPVSQGMLSPLLATVTLSEGGQDPFAIVRVDCVRRSDVQHLLRLVTEYPAAGGRSILALPILVDENDQIGGIVGEETVARLTLLQT